MVSQTANRGQGIHGTFRRGELVDYSLAHAARADLCRGSGRTEEARVAYREALRLTGRHRNNGHRAASGGTVRRIFSRALSIP